MRAAYRAQAVLDTLIPALMLVALLVLIILGVVDRTLNLGWPIQWTIEASEIAFTWITFLGAAACFRHGIAIAVESFYLMLPIAAKRVVYAMANLVILFCCVFCIYYGIEVVFRMWPQSTSMLGLSRGWTPLAIPVSMFFIGISSTCELVKTIVDDDLPREGFHLGD